jgi:hypothetical protein
VLLIVAWVTSGSQPKVGASADQLVAFYDGHRMRILMAGRILGFAVLGLLWFGAALSSVLRDAGKGGWGAAATASSAALGVVLFVHSTLSAALAYPIAGNGNTQLTAGLNDPSWVSMVVGSFSAAMFVMSGAFGLWRAGIISKAFFSAGMTAVVLALLGATTWAGDGVWAPDGAYARFVAPIVAVVWIAVASSTDGVLPR